MASLFGVRVENLGSSKLFVTSALLTSTGGGLMMAFLLVYFERTTTVGLAAIGVAITVGRAIAAVIPAAIGRLLDRVGPRRLAILGDLTTGFGFLLCLVANNMVVITASQFLTQAGSHLFWTSSRGLVGLASRGQGMQTWFGLVSSLRNLGLGLGTLLSSLVFSMNSELLLHILVLCCVLMYFASSFALWAWRTDDWRYASPENMNDGEQESRKKVWADRAYRRLLILNTGLVLAAMVIPLVIVVYITKQLGLPAYFAGGLVIANTAIVAIASTHVAAWTESRGASKNIINSYILNISAFVLFWIAVLVGQSLLAGVLVTGAMLIYTLAEMISTPAANVLSVELAPSVNNGSHMAAFQMTWSIGMTLCPALFGWLLTTSIHSTWVTLIALTLICLSTAVIPNRRRVC